MQKNLSVPFAVAVLLPNFSSAIAFENNFELAPDAMQFGQTAIDHIINPVSLQLAEIFQEDEAESSSLTYEDNGTDEEGLIYAQITSFAAQDANDFCSGEDVSKCEKGICKNH